MSISPGWVFNDPMRQRNRVLVGVDFFRYYQITMGSVKDTVISSVMEAAYEDVQEHQRQVIEAYLSRRDVFTFSPTGLGKSSAFELAIISFDFPLGVGLMVNKTLLIIAKTKRVA